MLYIINLAMSLSASDSAKSEIQLMCEYCGKRFNNKELLTVHLKTHTDKSKNVYFYCTLCNIPFRNKGLLGCHMSKKHPIINNNTKTTNNNTSKRKRAENKKTCDGCKKKFRYSCQLAYHVRKTHYNLISKPPYCTLQDVNQEWYEKVINTDFYAELKKFNANTLFIRRVDDSSVSPLDTPRDLIDLRMVYPTETAMKWFPCVGCSKFFGGKDLTEHVIENHSSIVTERCLNCNCFYKPLTTQLKHICPT